MNQNPTPRWSPLVSAPEDEFASFLDFGNLDFSAYSDGSGTPQAGANGASHGGDADDLLNGSAEGGQGGLHGAIMGTDLDGVPTPGMMSNHIGAMQPGAMEIMSGFGPNQFPDLNTMPADYLGQQQQQQQAQQMHSLQHTPRYYGHNAVPPTPNSLEIHGSHSADYYHHHADRTQAIMYEHYRRHQNEQVGLLGSDLEQRI